MATVDAQVVRKVMNEARLSEREAVALGAVDRSKDGFCIVRAYDLTAMCRSYLEHAGLLAAFDAQVMPNKYVKGRYTATLEVVYKLMELGSTVEDALHCSGQLFKLNLELQCALSDAGYDRTERVLLEPVAVKMNERGMNVIVLYTKGEVCDDVLDDIEEAIAQRIDDSVARTVDHVAGMDGGRGGLVLIQQLRQVWNTHQLYGRAAFAQRTWLPPHVFQRRGSPVKRKPQFPSPNWRWWEMPHAA